MAWLPHPPPAVHPTHKSDNPEDYHGGDEGAFRTRTGVAGECVSTPVSCMSFGSKASEWRAKSGCRCLWRQKIELGYRIELIVEGSVIVEIKCVEAINPGHQAQPLSYLRLRGRHVGLLINIHVAHLRNGSKRVVDGDDWSKASTTGHRGTQR